VPRSRREFLPALRQRISGALADQPAESKNLAERVRASSTGYVVPGQPYVSKWSTRRATEEGYEGNPLVYRCIEVICQHAIAQKIVLRQGDPDDGKTISEAGADPTRLLYVLNRRANPWETALTFRHRLVAQFLLSSKGVFIEVIRTESGRIGMLNLLDPDLCANVAVEKIDPQTREVIESDPIGTVQIQVPGGGYNYLPRFDPAADAITQPSSVLWVRSPHPLVLWRGMSPVQAAGMPIDLDKYARIYNRRFLQNDGRPGGLLSVKGVVKRTDMEQIQAQFSGGVDSAGRTTVISADAVSYVDTSGSPRDLMWGELSNATRKDIAMTMGVPESVMGDASGRTFDNADAEYEMFWTGRMLSLLRTLDDQLDVLTGGYDDDLYLRHDLSKVWVLGRHKRTIEDRALADYNAGTITIDEYRTIKDMKPWNVPATQSLWLPSGKVPVGPTQQITDAAAKLVPVGTAAPADPAASARAGAAEGSQIGARIAQNNNAANTLRYVASTRLPETALESSDITGGESQTVEGKQGGARGRSATEWS
jgi:HK97 family phage portal protein